MKSYKTFQRVLIAVIVLLMLISCNRTVDQNKDEGVKTGAVTINLYFSDADARYLRVESIQMTNPSPKSVLQQLIKGPASKNLFATMPDDITVIDVSVEEGIAYVNFSKEMGEAINGNYGTSTASQFLLYAIVNTLALNESLEIDQVKILVEGADIELGPFGKIGPQKPNLDIIKM